MQPNIPIGGASPAPAPRQADWWPEVRTGVGERPEPIWRPREHPATNVWGIGFLLGTKEYGRPHLERIAAWALDAVEQGKPLHLQDGEAVVAAYLRSTARVADHGAWLRAALEATHVLRPIGEVLTTLQARSIARTQTEAHEGWLRMAPRFVAELLAEGQRRAA